MQWKTFTHVAAFSALVVACNKDKGADSPEDVDEPMEEAGESVDEAAEDTEESLDEAGDEMGDAIDEAGDDLDGDPTTE